LAHDIQENKAVALKVIISEQERGEHERDMQIVIIQTVGFNRFNQPGYVSSYFVLSAFLVAEGIFISYLYSSTRPEFYHTLVLAAAHISGTRRKIFAFRPKKST
jgi:hypothetical protein